MIARSSHAACHSFFTVRRVGIVAARRSTALRFTRIDANSSRSNGIPGFRAAPSCSLSARSGDEPPPCDADAGEMCVTLLDAH